VACFQNRSAVTGRFQRIDPEHDLVPENVSAEDVYEVSDNSIARSAAVRVTDELEALGRLRQRTPVLADGYHRDRAELRDRNLVERAQTGTMRVPGTQTGDIPTGDMEGTL
jgi:glyoxylate carboligase